MSQVVKALLFSTLCTSALVFAQSDTQLRTGFIQCGQAQITARAECHEKTAFCVTETLAFARRSVRSIVPLHRNYATHDVSGRKLQVLDYHADSWACLPGKSGGHYLVVVMSRPGGGNCRECEYSRLYDLNGRLIAADFVFDSRGQPRSNKSGREMMQEVLGGPGPHAFVDVYR